MEAGFIVIVIVLIVAAVVGMCLHINRRSQVNSGKSKTQQLDIQGMLNIVYDELGRDPQLVLALYDPVENIINEKQVLFEVNIIRQNSQK